jgi:hypothetical protein
MFTPSPRSSRWDPPGTQDPPAPGRRMPWSGTGHSRAGNGPGSDSGGLGKGNGHPHPENRLQGLFRGFAKTTLSAFPRLPILQAGLFPHAAAGTCLASPRFPPQKLGVTPSSPHPGVPFSFGKLSRGSRTRSERGAQPPEGVDAASTAAVGEERRTGGAARSPPRNACTGSRSEIRYSLSVSAMHRQCQRCIRSGGWHFSRAHAD